MVIGHMDAQDIDQYRFRDRIVFKKILRIEKAISCSFRWFVYFLPNTFYGYDAGVPYEDKKEHDATFTIS